MSAIELVTGVIAVFFALGIIAGIACVIAISALRSADARARRERARRERAGRERAGLERRDAMGYGIGDGRAYPDDPDWDDPPGSDEDEGPPPRWPGYRGLLIRGN